LLFLAATALILATTVAAAPESVAEVNGIPITRQTFQIYYRPEVERLSAQGNPINEAHLRPLRARLIDYLVDSELLLQAAERQGIKIADEVLNRAVETARANYPSEAQFSADLQKQRLSLEDYRERLRRELTIKKLIVDHIAKDVVVSEEDVRAYYDQHPERFRVPEKLHIRHITLRFPLDAGETEKSEVRERTAAIQHQVDAGGDFAELARKYSEDPSRQKGGDEGFVDADWVARTFGQAVLQLSTGLMSAPIETPQGYHLVIVEARQPARVIPLEQVQAGIRQALFRQKTSQPIKAYVENLRKNARIVIHE
jgi:parvulin-like peptidyl-prolyl isomerase